MHPVLQMLQKLNAYYVPCSCPFLPATGVTKGAHYALVKETFPGEVESG